MKIKSLICLACMVCLLAAAGSAGAEWHFAGNIADASRHLCYDYYGNLYNYSGHSEDFAWLVGQLPVLHYTSGIPCIRSHTYVYSGPSTRYWQLINERGNYAYTGLLDTNLRVYGRDGSWIMIRYPSSTNGGYRYGWCTEEAIRASDLRRIPPIELACVEVSASNWAYMYDDPDVSRHTFIRGISETIDVKALAFLDESRRWVYCEATVVQTGEPVRSFIRVEDLLPNGW